MREIPAHWEDAAAWLAWVQRKQRQASQMEWKIWSGSWAASSSLGPYQDADFRRFVLGLYAADLGCYPKGVQVDFDRLLYTVGRFSRGFSLWMVQEEGDWIPVGYSGWHPISSFVFSAINAAPEQADPDFLQPDLHSEILYLFNYSVLPQYRRTILSKSLLEQLAQEVQGGRILCAGTV